MAPGSRIGQPGQPSRPSRLDPINLLLPGSVITVILAIMSGNKSLRNSPPVQGGALVASRPGTLHGRAYDRIRQKLIGGVLKPGEKLSLRSVAEGLGMSMQPVREAVARLIADEALEVAPNRAVRVPMMSMDRFRELTTIRLSIEGFAAEMAAVHCERAALAQIRLHDRAFRQQCRRADPDVDLAVQANHDLHFAVYRAAALPSLLPIIEGLWLRIGPILNLDMRGSAQRLGMGGAEACHAAIVAGLAARSPARARAALERDIRQAAIFILNRGILPGASETASRDGTPRPSIRTRRKDRQWSWEYQDYG